MQAVTHRQGFLTFSSPQSRCACRSIVALLYHFFALENIGTFLLPSQPLGVAPVQLIVHILYYKIECEKIPIFLHNGGT